MLKLNLMVREQDGKESACNTDDLVQSLGQEDPLEKGMATHSSIPAWKILWKKEPQEPDPWCHKDLDTTEKMTLSRFRLP